MWKAYCRSEAFLSTLIEIPELSDRCDSSDIVTESWCRILPAAIKVNLSALWWTFSFFLRCINKRSRKEKYLGEICFILEEGWQKRKINFTKCICDDLQKQLINYSLNERRERESAQIPPLAIGHVMRDLILSLFVLAVINFPLCANKTGASGCWESIFRPYFRALYYMYCLL